jgi:hypothetical protein
VLLPPSPSIYTAPSAFVASAIPDIPGPSTSHAISWPDTSHDDEVARRLFIELNHEAMGIKEMVVL